VCECGVLVNCGLKKVFCAKILNLSINEDRRQVINEFLGCGECVCECVRMCMCMCGLKKVFCAKILNLSINEDRRQAINESLCGCVCGGVCVWVCESVRV